jgi:hypothetical protein
LAASSEVKTLDDVLNCGLDSNGGWRLVDEVDWSEVPVGLCPGIVSMYF